MISVQNEIARTAPATQQESAVAADLSDFAANVDGSNLDRMRLEHAQTWAATTLSNADLSAVANTQQTVQVGNAEFAVSSDITRGLNAQAGANATVAANKMVGMGFSPDAVKRAQELILHHSVAAGSSTTVEATGAADLAQSEAQDIDTHIGQQEDLTNGIAQGAPQAQTEAIAQDDANLDGLMEDLSAQIDQDTQLASATANDTSNAVAQEIEDPLADSPYMRIETEVEQPLANGLTQETGIQLAADTGRLDVDFSDRLDVAQDGQMNGAEIQSGLRFDYQADQAVASAPEQNANVGFDTPLGPALAIAPVADVAFKLARGSSPGETRRVGRERQSVFPVAA